MLALWIAAALAQDPVADADPRFDELGLGADIDVYAEPFARWDDTRWYVHTELGMPWPMVFQADENYEFAAHLVQVRMVFHCQKDWPLGKKRYEVSCAVEDVGLQATARQGAAEALDTRTRKAEQVLAEIDAKLTGATVQLQVRDDGRVVDFDLEDIGSGNRRQNEIEETLRQLVMRLFTGFDMRVKVGGAAGTWPEYNPKLMSMPSMNATQGSSMLVHVGKRWKGNIIVQSRGKGTIAEGGNFFDTEYTGVSAYDGVEGYMLERVWALVGRPTASSYLAEAQGAVGYYHVGRFRLLGPDEHPDCGPTRRIAPRGQHVEGLPDWEPLE